MDINTTALKVITPKGEFYAIFPDDAEHCELHGFDVSAIHYFESNLFRMSRQHGYRLTLTQLEPEELLLYGNRPDFQISIIDEFDREELALL